MGKVVGASPRHTAGSRPDAPPGRGKCGDRRTTNPELAGAVGRTNCDTPHRRYRRSFFSPPHQGNKPRAGITEQSLDPLQRAKARKGICVRQSTAFEEFGHPHIMPTFRPFTMWLISHENRLCVVIRPLDLPIRNHEDPIFLIRARTTVPRLPPCEMPIGTCPSTRR